MAFISQLMVELGINTAAFQGGMDRATHTAKAFANELQGHFRSLSSGVQGLTSMFGSMNPIFSNVASVAGEAFSTISSSISGAGGVMGAFLGVTVGVGAAAAAAAVGIGLLAEEGAETVRTFEQLSLRTGLAISDLQALGAMGKTVGLPLESLAMGFRRFGVALNSYNKDSSAAAHTLHALGISSHDPMTAFLQLADAVKNTQDQTERMAIVTDLFGARMGGKLIPVLAQGREGVEKWIAANKEFGAVIDGTAIEETNKWHESTAKLGLAWDDVKVRSTGALTYMAEALTLLLNLTKGVSNATSTMFTAGEYGGLLETEGPPTTTGKSEREEKQDAIDAQNKTQKEQNERQGAINAQLQHALDLVKAGGPAEAELVALKKTEADYEKKIGETTGAAQAEAAKLAIETQKKIPAAERAAKLEKESLAYLMNAADLQKKESGTGRIEVEKAWAASLRKSTDETIANAVAADVKAKQEAEMEKVVTLDAAAQAKAAEIVKNSTAEWTRNAYAIEEARKSGQIAAQIDAVAKKLREQTESAKAAAAATTTVAREQAKLVGGYNEARNALERYEKELGAQGIMTVSLQALERLEQLRADLEKAGIALKAASDNVPMTVLAKTTEEWEKKLDAADKALAKITIDDPFLDVAEEMRILTKESGLSAEELDKVRKIMEKIRADQAATKVATGALGAAKSMAGFDPNEMKQLNDELVYLAENWRKLGMSAEQYRITVIGITAQMADLKAKSGGFRDGLNAGFADFIKGAKSTGEVMKETIGKGLTDLTDDFAKMCEGGKVEWQKLIIDMEDILIKAAFQKLLASIFSSIGLGGGGGLFGGGGGTGIGGLFGLGGMMASGGDVSPGKAYIVGEKGPELMVPGSSGQIMPNGMLGNLGSKTIVQNYLISTPDANSFQQSQAQIASAGYRQAVMAARRS